MASNHTEHFDLNQWELSDSVIMSDFNQDNAKIEQALLSLKASLPKFQSGSYVGTGTCGADNPITLTFDFEPQLLIVAIAPAGETIDEAETALPLVAIRGASTASMSYSPTYSSSCSQKVVHLNWTGNTVSWYSTHLFVAHYNCKNTTYRYLAIG